MTSRGPLKTCPVLARWYRVKPRGCDRLVLCYHAVSAEWPAKIAVTPDRLEEQLRLLLRRGYRGATFTEAATAPANGRFLAVTFDDAYRSVLKHAFPIMSRLGLPGTVFVPTNFAGSE